MKESVRMAAVAVLLAGFMWPAGRAAAAPSCGASLADLPGCATAQACALKINSEALKYIAAIQTIANALITGSVKGTNHTQQTYRCVGGSQAGKLCEGNNGGCTSGKTKAACNNNVDCGAGVCNFGAGHGCNSTQPDSLTGNFDEFECQPNPGGVFRVSAQGAEKALRTNIRAKCLDMGVPANDVGLDGITACPDAATAGTCTSELGTPNCTKSSQCSIGSCVANDSERYNALIACIMNSAAGDFETGKVQDTILRVFDKISGTLSAAPRAKPAASGGPADPFPRQIQQLAGYNSLQIGSGVPSNTSGANSPGGGVTTLSLSHCVGGNGKNACLNNVDCDTGNCVRNSAGGGTNSVTGPTSVHKCCNSPGGDAGTSCAINGDCSSLDCSVNSNCLGNVLSVTQANTSFASICLVAHSRNAGNGTAALGSINLTTGAYNDSTPMSTDVFGGPCPTCGNSGCGPGIAQCCSNDSTQKCSVLDSVSQECLPKGFPISSVLMPFSLTSGTTSLTASTVIGTPNKCGFCDDLLNGGANGNGICDDPPCPKCLDTSAPCTGGRTCDSTSSPSKAFCGSCSDFLPQGCQKTADCVVAGHAGPCTFTGALPGAHGDCSITQITTTGEPSLYGPVVAGVFCIGRTGNGLVDADLGLPGPVRVQQPSIMGYVFSTDQITP